MGIEGTEGRILDNMKYGIVGELEIDVCLAVLGLYLLRAICLDCPCAHLIVYGRLLFLTHFSLISSNVHFRKFII